MGDFLRVPVVSTPAGFGGPSAGTWAYGPWPSAPDPRLSGEPGVSPPGPPHLGLLEEGTEGSVVRLEGWGPLASGASPWLNWSDRESLGPEAVQGTWLQRPPTVRWGLPGSAPDSGCVFRAQEVKRKVPKLSRSYLSSG